MKRAWVAAVAAVVWSSSCLVGDRPVRKPPPEPSDQPCASSGTSDLAGAPMEPPPIENTSVVTPAHAPPPVSGGTLAVLSDGSFVAADPDRDVVWLVGADRKTVRKVTLNSGDEPGRVAEGPSGQVFVALRGAGEVAQLDVANAALVERRAVCGAPRGLAWLATDATLAVACATGVLARLSYEQDPSGAWAFKSIERQLPAEDLRDVVSVGSVLYVTSFRSGKLFAVDRTGKATELQLPSLGVGEGALSDGGTLAPTFARGVAWRMTAGPTGPLITHQWSSLAPIPLAKGSCGLEGSPEYGSSLFGEPLVHGGITALSQGKAFEEQAPFTAPIGMDIAAGPNGAWAIASPQTVHIYTERDTFAELGGIGEPTSVAWSGNTLVVFSREPALLAFLPDPGLQTAYTTLSFPGESARSTGHELFHRVMFGSSRLACASCHPEGGDDGRVWLLPEGSRRTPSLRGGIAATAPFHWSGDLDGMQSLMDEVMVRRMGGLRQTPERTDALLSWLDGLKAMRAPDGVNLEAAMRGRALFESSAVGCVSCHSGAQGTNNANTNVGTGEVLQVPRLTELGTRAPYFHDGRVASLEQRFTPVAGGDQHGHVSQLSPAEIADLVAYLKTR